MLGTNKWRLLTMVAGILLAHAIDSPGNYGTPRVASTVPHTEIAQATHQPQWSDRVARNLYSPYESFSNVDQVRYVERRSTAYGVTNGFGAFRYSSNSEPLKRRSDEPVQSPTTEKIQSTAVKSTVSPQIPKPRYVYIPINAFDKSTTALNNATLQQQPENQIQSRTDSQVNENDEVKTTNNVKFPDVTTENISGRRSGIEFPAQSQKFENVFIPQGYREDSIAISDGLPYQRPYNEELPSGSGSQLPPQEYDIRFSRGILHESSRPYGSGEIESRPVEFPKPLIRHFPDQEVTKFGDINGPITAIPQPAPPPPPQQSQLRPSEPIIEKQSIRPFDNSFFVEDFRPSRHYFPPKAFVEYSDYPGPPKSRFVPPWKSRSPRVVFPQSDNIPSGPSSTYNADNVVFR